MPRSVKEGKGQHAVLEGEYNEYNSSQLTHCEIIRFMANDFQHREYANSGLRGRSPAPSNASQSENADLLNCGGLCDDDLEDIRPAVEEVGSPGLISHGNEVSVVRDRN